MGNTYKRVPFDVELAKKIQLGEVEGRIITKAKNGYLPVSLKQIDTISSTLNICHRHSHIEVKYGHKSMLQYLKGSTTLLIELPEETPICNNPDSPKCKICSNWHCNDCQYNKHELKPFDKVLVRENNNQAWRCDVFSHMSLYDKEKYRCIGAVWTQCIPYEGNEHLLGTTNNPE